jgi:16S rRNA (cytosine967-C5)-methyltransferase
VTAPRRRAKARTAVDPARRTAFDALVSVEGDGAYLNLALARLLGERGLEGRDAAFATELAHGTTRLRGTYDAILATCVTGSLDGLEVAVLSSLRLGAHQLLNMRVPAYAAVATSVELVRESAGERPVRLVNAVLRKVGSRQLAHWVAELAPDPVVDPVGNLAFVTSHPRWIVEAFAMALERDGADAGRLRGVLDADNVPPRVTLAARPGLSTVAELMSEGGERGRWSPYAVSLPGGDPGHLPAIRAGRAGVQDEGSQLAAIALARAVVVGRDETWLDLCAGPGGKSALLAGLAGERGATLVANELLEHRANLVRGTLRSFSRPAPVVVADGRRGPWRADSFDRVLVDAPCLGLGALRRRPDSRWRHAPGDLPGLVELQARLLESALRSVRPGGVVAYVTCSPHVAETREAVEAVLPEAVELDGREVLPEVEPLGPGPHVQLWPDLHGTDAMFIALLRRSS